MRVSFGSTQSSLILFALHHVASIKAVGISKDDCIVKRSNLPSLVDQGHPVGATSSIYDHAPQQLVYNGQSQEVPEYLSRHPSLQSLSADEYKQHVEDGLKYQQEELRRNRKAKTSKRRSALSQVEKAAARPEHLDSINEQQGGAEASPPTASTSTNNKDNTISAGEAALFWGLLGTSFVGSADLAYRGTRRILHWDDPTPEVQPGQVELQQAPHPNDQERDDGHVLHKRGSYNEHGEYVPDYDYASSGIHMPAVYGQNSYPYIPLSSLRNPVGYIDPHEAQETYIEEVADQPSSSSSRRKKGQSNRKLLESPTFYPPPSMDGTPPVTNYYQPALAGNTYASGMTTSPDTYYTGPPGDQHLETLSHDSGTATAVEGAMLGTVGVGLLATGAYYGYKNVKERRRRAAEAAGGASAAAPPPPVQRQAPATQSRPAPQPQRQAPAQHHLDVEDDDYSDDPEPLQQRRPAQAPPAGQGRAIGTPPGRRYQKRSLFDADQVKG